MLKAESIDHINITVKNLESSVSFYKKFFGFDIKKEQPEDNSKIIGNDRIKLCLYEDKNLEIGEGINHFGFYIENFEEIIKTCKELGVKIEYGGEIEWGKSKSIYIEDPNGYTIELSNKKGGGL